MEQVGITTDTRDRQTLARAEPHRHGAGSVVQSVALEEPLEVSANRSRPHTEPHCDFLVREALGD